MALGATRRHLRRASGSWANVWSPVWVPADLFAVCCAAWRGRKYGTSSSAQGPVCSRNSLRSAQREVSLLAKVTAMGGPGSTEAAVISPSLRHRLLVSLPIVLAH